MEIAFGALQSQSGCYMGAFTHACDPDGGPRGRGGHEVGGRQAQQHSSSYALCALFAMPSTTDWFKEPLTSVPQVFVPLSGLKMCRPSCHASGSVQPAPRGVVRVGAGGGGAER
jgi:hypothetical protein